MFAGLDTIRLPCVAPPQAAQAAAFWVTRRCGVENASTVPVHFQPPARSFCRNDAARLHLVDPTDDDLISRLHPFGHGLLLVAPFAEFHLVRNSLAVGHGE